MSNHSRTGGILSIISGTFSVFYLLAALLSAYMFRFIFSLAEVTSGDEVAADVLSKLVSFMTVFYVGYGVFLVLIGALAVIGGIYALKKKSWGMALAGAIAGTFVFFACGIPALIFVCLGRQEFAAAERPGNTGNGTP